MLENAVLRKAPRKIFMRTVGSTAMIEAEKLCKVLSPVDAATLERFCKRMGAKSNKVRVTHKRCKHGEECKAKIRMLYRTNNHHETYVLVDVLWESQRTLLQLPDLISRATFLIPKEVFEVAVLIARGTKTTRREGGFHPNFLGTSTHENGFIWRQSKTYKDGAFCRRV